MFRNSPKLIFKVQLLNKNNLRVELLMLDKFYINYTGNTFFFSNDIFLIDRSQHFCLFKGKTLYLPKKYEKTKKYTYLYFSNEEERYVFLKKLNNALIEWSNSRVWKGFNKPHTSKIVYNKDKWILY